MNNTIHNLILPGSVMISPLLIEVCGDLESAWVMAHLLKAKTGEWVEIVDELVVDSSSKEELLKGFLKKGIADVIWLTKSPHQVRVNTANLEAHLKYYSDPLLQQNFSSPREYIQHLIVEQGDDAFHPVSLNDVERLSLPGDNPERLRVAEKTLDSTFPNSDSAVKNSEVSNQSKRKKEPKKEKQSSLSDKEKERVWRVSDSITNSPQDQIVQSDPAKEAMVEIFLNIEKEQTWTQQCLEYFSNITKIPIPNRHDPVKKTLKGKPKENKEYGALWVKPIVVWLRMTSDLPTTLKLIKQTVEQMDSERLSIYSPNSIHKTLVALYAKEQRQKTVREVW